MSKSPAIRVSKIDAAKRQLDTAITLWFEEEDEVSIHALSCNAYQVVTDILKSRRIEHIALDSMIRDEYKAEANRLLRAPMNFVKHADRDADEILEFRPGLSDGFILLAMYGLRTLGETLSQEQHAFSWYLSVHKPHLLTEEGQQLITSMPPDGLQALKEVSKAEFLEFIIHVLAQNKLKR